MKVIEVEPLVWQGIHPRVLSFRTVNLMEATTKFSAIVTLASVGVSMNMEVRSWELGSGRDLGVQNFRQVNRLFLTP